ncbi:MAG: hypothetical protein WAL80_15015 [Xanthobacteraceae bacterium]|jgi:hypothetical protein
MICKRYIAVAILFCLGPALGSCGGASSGGFTSYVADHWPRWAGGMPDDVPPRPGAPGYNEFISHDGADQNATKSIAGPGAPAPEFVATGTSPTGKKAAAAAKPIVQPASAPRSLPPQVSPPQVLPPQVLPPQVLLPQAPPPETQSPQDSSVVKGGLY